jgi:hypothetical protein
VPLPVTCTLIVGGSDPTMDTGVDFAAEYKAAVEMNKA